MNYYINIINDSIEYIEENLSGELSLEIISNKFHLSQYHFDRLFNIIAGVSFKKYVNGRRLTLASEELTNSGNSIIDIAFKYGFNYPEVFSRAFKRQFGISPKEFKCTNKAVNSVSRAVIIPRNLINYNGRVILKPEYIELNKIKLYGISQILDVYKEGFEKDLYDSAKKFIKQSEESKCLKGDKLYNLICCNGEGSSTYTAYFAREIIQSFTCDERHIRSIPKGLYAKFIYKGRMSDIRKTFENDLFRWIAVKEIKLNPVGIGMISIYDEDYYKNGQIKILIPVCDKEK